MATVASIGLPRVQFLDAKGKPAIGGKVTTYRAGSTTKAPTYRDSTGLVPNTNPVVLDGRGECELWFDVGLAYKLAPQLANGTKLPVQDNLRVPGAGIPGPEGPPGTADLSELLADDGSTLVNYRPSWSGSVGRLVADWFEDSVSVTTFMTPAQRADCRSHGAAMDASPAFQAAFTYAALKGKKVRVPAGSYRLDTPVTVTSADVMVEGDGQEITKILVNNTTGGIFFNQGVRAGTAYMGGAHSMTFVAYGTGNVLRGTALSFIYPKQSGAPATPHLFVSELSFRSVGGVSDVTQPRFTTSLYIKNAHCVQVEKVSSYQIANNNCTAIFLDYDVDAYAYRVSLRSLSLEGHQYGVRALGAIENLLISDYEIAVPQFGIFCDASGVDHMTPLLTIFGGHVNATNRSISVTNWASVQIDQPNVAIYTGEFTTDASVYGAYFQSCNFIEWTGGIINSLDGGSAFTTLMQFSFCQRFTVTGLVGYINYSATGVHRGLQIDNTSNRGVITGNQFESVGGVSDTGIFVQTGSGTDDHIVVTGNICFNFGSGVALINEFGCKVRGNDFTNCVVPILVTGTRTETTIVKDNYPANGRAPITGATPSVGSMPDGRVTVTNGGVTTITDFTNGYDGQEIDLLFSDGNTSVAHNSRIFLQGSVAAAFAVSTMLRLKYDAGSQLWYEIGRRT